VDVRVVGVPGNRSFTITSKRVVSPFAAYAAVAQRTEIMTIKALRSNVCININSPKMKAFLWGRKLRQKLIKAQV
jgi:hypothetical protein